MLGLALAPFWPKLIDGPLPETGLATYFLFLALDLAILRNWGEKGVEFRVGNPGNLLHLSGDSSSFLREYSSFRRAVFFISLENISRIAEKSFSFRRKLFFPEFVK